MKTSNNQNQTNNQTIKNTNTMKNTIQKSIFAVAMLATVMFSDNVHAQWSLTGNAGTTPGTHFVGTTDSKALYFKTNNSTKMAITSQGSVGIGTSTPGALLDVYDGTNHTRFTSDQIQFSRSTGPSYLINTNVGGSMDFVTNGRVPMDANSNLVLKTDQNSYFNGNVGIGTTPTQYKLSVCGTIQAKEVRVETNWCDYVFADNYDLAPLSEVESYIKENKHLPNVTSGPAIENEGLEVGKVSSQMIRKIEELTLYVIELQKQVDTLKAAK